MNQFSLDHLDSTEFEEFCIDLLRSLKFSNINWRKGTGFSASPADQGRDIECDYFREDVDNNIVKEKWFVECKHYKKGVPADKLQNAISWASAENPDCLLIVVSNFLSNSSKNYIDDYIINNKPNFRIKIWEKPELEKLILGKSKILRKYNIGGEFPFLTIMNPIHLMYIREPSLNTLDYFFETLDKLTKDKKDELMQFTYFKILNPEFSQPVTGKEKMKDLIIGDLNYEEFKSKCYNLTEKIMDSFLVNSIVNDVLIYIFNRADETRKDIIIKKHKDTVEYFTQKLKETSDNERRKSLKKLINMFKEKKETASKDIDKAYSLYNYFCVEVVSELFKEKIIFDNNSIMKSKK